HTFGNNEIKDLLSQKKAAMAVTWSGQLGVVNREFEDVEDLGFSTFDTAWNVTWSFGIARTSKNKEKAKEFLSYLRSKQVDSLVGSYCGAPVRKSNYVEGMDKQPWYKVQLEMIEKYASPFMETDQAQVKNSILYEELYQAFIGEKEAACALSDAKDRIKVLEERSPL
ncbi:MAG: extracellular solute-binding protein family 1, partial [Eubacterium sp.]|nr:extracellular solute-binding protein family 1 [Eubacterium sp.]